MYFLSESGLISNNKKKNTYSIFREEKKKFSAYSTPWLIPSKNHAFFFLVFFPIHQPLFKILCPSLKKTETVVHSEFGFCLSDQQGQDNKSLNPQGITEHLMDLCSYQGGKIKKKTFRIQFIFKYCIVLKKRLQEDHI